MRVPPFVVSIVMLSGCTAVLDYGLEGHLCGEGGECLTGYLCNAANICVPPAQARCEPECGAFEECERQVCVPTCKDKGCPSGTQCHEGACMPVPVAENVEENERLGTLCRGDDDCRTPKLPTAPRLRCLLPFGGHASGVCTKECVDDLDCGASAPSCRGFESGVGDYSVQLCVAKSLLPCRKDAACAASGLVCGVYDFGSKRGEGADVRGVTACRAPIRSAGAVGVTEPCQPDANPCVTGLCVATSTTGLSKCTQLADCPADYRTGYATVGGRILDVTYPYVRAQMCLPGGSSIGALCESDPAKICQADAPNCVRRDDAHALACAPRCSDEAGDRCARAAGFECVEVGDAAYCFRR